MQTVDPRQGFGRSKSLLTKVAAKAMARKGYNSRVGAFGKLATSGQQARQLRPVSGPGARMGGKARPQGYGDFFDGMGRGAGASDPGGGYVNTAPVQAPIPDMYRSPQTPPTPAAPGAGANAPISPEAQAWLQEQMIAQGLDPSTAISAPAPDTIAAPQPGMISAGPQPGGVEALLRTVGPNGYQQGSPSGTITAPGGLIPLGSGRYYDPVTDTIHGGGFGHTGA